MHKRRRQRDPMTSSQNHSYHAISREKARLSKVVLQDHGEQLGCHGDNFKAEHFWPARTQLFNYMKQSF